MTCAVPLRNEEPRGKPTTFLFQLVNAECVQVTIRTQNVAIEADPNSRSDSSGPGVKRSRPPIRLRSPQPSLQWASSGRMEYTSVSDRSLAFRSLPLPARPNTCGQFP